jgi:hypothetical protein
MSRIDLPDLKQKLWHSMRDDLKTLVPWFAGNDLLFCPACLRPLSYDQFSVEHIIPKLALACDPVDVREAVPQNERSGTTLLCKERLVINGKPIKGHGCNSWKGKHFDPSLRDLLRSDFFKKTINSRHQVALFSAGYLGLFRQFGYQITLSATGRLMRDQFFHPNDFLREVPNSCKMILGGSVSDHYDPAAREYWSESFKIKVEGNKALMVIRNMAFELPLSRDPTTPLALSLPYAPPKHTFRPDLRTLIG